MVGLEEWSETVRKRWVEQLYNDYSTLSYYYALKLKPVQIHIKSMAPSCLGQWDPARRIITLDESMIADFRWELVLEVLKHEMSHQYVTDNLGDKDSHGESFRIACEKLRVAPWAQTPRVLLRQDLEGLDTQSNLREDQITLLRKVKKLLSLAQSTNENEAALAMAKVQELCVQHNLDAYFEKTQQHNFAVRIINSQKKRTPSYWSWISSLLVEHYEVKVIQSFVFCAKQLHEQRTLEIIGLSHQVEIAEYVFWFLENNLKLWSKEKSLTKSSQKNSYSIGVLEGFRKKLSSVRKQQNDLTENALIKTNEINLQAHYLYLHPRLRKNTTRISLDKNSRIYDDGFKKGLTLSINKGIKNPPLKPLRLETRS